MLAIHLFQTVLWSLFQWAMRWIDGFCKNKFTTPQTETWATADWKVVCASEDCSCRTVLTHENYNVTLVLYIQYIKTVMFARGFLLTCITTEGYLNCVILQFKGWCWSFPWNHHDQWIPYWAQNKRANLLHLVKDLWTSTGWFATLTTSKLSWQCWSLIKRRTGELLCRSVNCFTKATWF